MALTQTRPIEQSIGLPSSSLEKDIDDMFKIEAEKKVETTNFTSKVLSKIQFTTGEPGKLTYDVSLFDNSILIEATDLEDILTWSANVYEPIEAVSKNNDTFKIKFEPAQLYEILASYADGSYKKDPFTMITFPKGMKSEDAPIFFELQFSHPRGFHAFAMVSLEPKHIPHDQRIHKKLENVKLRQMEVVRECDEKLKLKDTVIGELKTVIEELRTEINETDEYLDEAIEELKKELTTKIDTDITKVKQEMTAEFAKVRQEFGALIAALKLEVTNNTAAMNKKIEDGDNSVRGILHQKYDALKVELTPKPAA